MRDDAPDPGTVEDDQRCEDCAAGPDDDCDIDCTCWRCERRRAERRELAALDVNAGEK